MKRQTDVGAFQVESNRLPKQEPTVSHQDVQTIASQPLLRVPTVSATQVLLSDEEKLRRIPITQPCPKHPRKNVHYYCKLCEVTICEQCVIEEHNNVQTHKILPLEDMAVTIK